MEHARRLCAAVVRWVKFYEERARVARKSGNVGIESTLETVISRVVFALSRQRLPACSSAGHLYRSSAAQCVSWHPSSHRVDWVYFFDNPMSFNQFARTEFQN
jgi:hypothetical protein